MLILSPSDEQSKFTETFFIFECYLLFSLLLNISLPLVLSAVISKITFNTWTHACKCSSIELWFSLDFVLSAIASSARLIPASRTSAQAGRGNTLPRACLARDSRRRILNKRNSRSCDKFLSTCTLILICWILFISRQLCSSRFRTWLLILMILDPRYLIAKLHCYGSILSEFLGHLPRSASCA